MKNLLLRIKQVIKQRPLKYGSILIVVIGLIVVSIVTFQTNTNETSHLLTQISSTDVNKATQSGQVQTSQVSQANNSENSSASTASTAESSQNSSPATKYYVEIKGEVVKPNVYQISEQARLNDLVKLAGGLTPEADQVQLNLAQPVQDGMSIYVPKKGEELVVQGPNANDLTANMSGTSSAEFGIVNKVNLNQADATELQQVSGIGPKKAADIIAHRQKEGPFQSVDDLTKVSGIGIKTLENIRDQLTI